MELSCLSRFLGPHQCGHYELVKHGFRDSQEHAMDKFTVLLSAAVAGWGVCISLSAGGEGVAAAGLALKRGPTGGT